MFQTVEIISILLVALAMAPALAHLLEFPGKSRLTKDAYLTVQPIYYPGFTIAGGIGEGGGLIAVLAILHATRHASVLAEVDGADSHGRHASCLLAVDAAGNKFWLQGTALGGFGHAFFDFRPGTDRVRRDDPDAWTKMRDRWEYSHIARIGDLRLSVASCGCSHAGLVDMVAAEILEKLDPKEVYLRIPGPVDGLDLFALYREAQTFLEGETTS